jgi:Fis family transcriptional regulator, factor for inversion stimulation protein
MKEKFDGLIDHLLRGNMFLQEAIELMERTMIQRVLDETAGNQCAASKQLGIHRNTLQRKMQEYGIGNGRAPRRKPVVPAAKSKKRKKTAA